MVIEQGNVALAFLLTILAGLATGIGSIMAFLSKKFNHKFLAASLGFSAGVMIYISLVEIFDEAKSSLIGVYGEKSGYWITILSFFAGVALIGIIDKLVPSFENPHELKNIEPHNNGEKKLNEKKLMRMGLFSALAIAIHNFPEGLATFIGALQNPTFGVSITLAIAIHNIPEGIAVSVPIYYATKNRKKAFTYSFLSGFAEPVGALIGYIAIKNFFNEAIFGMVFASVAGIMVYISLDELLPTAEEYGEHHIAIGGLIGGMVVMAVSLGVFL